MWRENVSVVKQLIILRQMAPHSFLGWDRGILGQREAEHGRIGRLDDVLLVLCHQPIAESEALLDQEHVVEFEQQTDVGVAQTPRRISSETTADGIPSAVELPRVERHFSEDGMKTKLEMFESFAFDESVWVQGLVVDAITFAGNV